MDNIEWLGHDSFRITSRGGKVVYIDPWKIDSGEKADLILVTHDHFDHFSKPDIEKIRKPETEIMVGSEAGTVRSVKPGDVLRAKGFEVEVVPAYNVNKFKSPGQVFHPKDYKGVGYVIKVDGKRVYHAGDTDRIQEMKALKAIDIALLPVSGTYVMTPEEAAEAAQDIRPGVAIPMHYGSIVGSSRDAEWFKHLCEKKGIRVEILE